MRIGRRQALVGGALALGACGKQRHGPPWLEGDAGGDAGADSGSSFGSPVEIGPTSTPYECPPKDAIAPIFASERWHSARPAARTFYSWTTLEQIAELRAKRVLFTRTERPGLGPGYAMELFASLAGTGNEQARVAALLAGDVFAKARYAWISAWATRMGWPGESYGDQLLRIDLRAEAWVVAFYQKTFRAVDMSNHSVPLTDVLASPERIGAIYFVKDNLVGECEPDGGPVVGRKGSFGGPLCATELGYREYILGNEAMVESFSHATDATRAEIERGRSLLTTYRDQVPPKPSREPAWNFYVSNRWLNMGATSCTEQGLYEDALAIPSALYEPVAGTIDAIVDTLGAGLFTPDPFIVYPERDGG